ncbi:MAG: alpha-amylase family glycosyl hydrolase [Rubrivivax sp.]|jgi:glycosidase
MLAHHLVRSRPWCAAALASLLSLGAVTAAARTDGLKLHVPSPDWRDQIIYFVMTDRFADGNPYNNDLGAGVYDPTRSDRYNGGDLRGLRQRLNYVQGLGATAVWLTPPVLNQWHDPHLGFYGYHGYWAQHFKKVDPHVGTLADYQRLSDALHRRGMYLVQDIVVNHVGNHFDYVGGWDPADPTRFYRAHTGGKPASRPTQAPFHLNDPRRPRDRRAGIYHWTPAVADVTQRAQELRWQMSSLDDLATTNPVVRHALRDSHGYWIDAVGVDAFRVDTAFYVEPEFFEDFLFARGGRAPGMVERARRTGRRHFLVFGEGFGIDAPGQDVQARRIEAYMNGPNGERRMDGMLNFPLYGALLDVFARGRPPAELADRITRMMALHPRVHWMPTFIDNHDVDRWLAGGSEASMRQALLAVMTLPGIPVLYYGTEQGFTAQRAAMFAAGAGSGGRDRYDTAHPLYRFTAEVTGLRQAQRVFRRGVPQVLSAHDGAPGLIAWRSTEGNEAAVVVFNTADHALLVDRLPVGAPGTVLQPLLGLHGLPGAQQADAEGRIDVTLPARGAAVWKVTAASAPPARAQAPALDPLPVSTADPARGDFEVTGHAHGAPSVQVVLDGDLDRARTVTPDADGRFRARIDTARLTEPGATHRVVAYAPGRGASVARTFRADLPWVPKAEVSDPAGDDRGLDARITYPTHESFAPRQMDLRGVRVSQAGGALRVEVQMAALTQVWSPQNGFDHVAFTIFVERAGEPGGQRAMPFQNGELPGDMRWHLRLRAHGWTNTLFRSEGAGAQADGTPVTPAARIQADPQRHTVTFTIPAQALGDRTDLRGTRLWVTTWDYDGGYRPLAAEAAPYVMGGPPGTPKVMDATEVIVLP